MRDEVDFEYTSDFPHGWSEAMRMCALDRESVCDAIPQLSTLDENLFNDVARIQRRPYGRRKNQI